ncbi:MAG: GNAT family N-acetyltransferase [Acidimicrobiales bacterium]
MTDVERRVGIERATEVTEQLVEDLARLIPQLSSSSQPPTRAVLEEIVGSANSALFLAGVVGSGGGSRVIGMLTLACYRVPTGIHAVIEDVVVDEGARGAGAGSALVKAALAEAERLGAKHVDLTSRPSRQAANKMYLKMGFAARETNIYRYELR